MTTTTMKEYTYMEFGYPVTLKNVTMGCCDGYWYPQINRDTILKNESIRLMTKFMEVGKWPNDAEAKVLNEAIDKGFIDAPELPMHSDMKTALYKDSNE